MYINDVNIGSATGEITLDDACDRTPNYYFFKMGADFAFDVIGETKSQYSPAGITTVSLVISLV